jgi:hypothetical protein
MKYVRLCRYNGPVEENYPYSQEVTLQEHTFEDDTTAIAHIFPDSSIVFVEAVDTEVSFKDVPLDVSRFVSNISVLYQVHRQLGADNLTEFSVVPPSGFIYDVLEESSDDITSVLNNESYPVSQAEYNINGQTLQIEGNELRCCDGFDLEPVFRTFDTAVQEHE